MYKFVGKAPPLSVLSPFFIKRRTNLLKFVHFFIFAQVCDKSTITRYTLAIFRRVPTKLLQNHESVDRKKLKTFRSPSAFHFVLSFFACSPPPCLLCCWCQGSLFSPLHGNGREFRTRVRVIQSYSAKPTAEKCLPRTKLVARERNRRFQYRTNVSEIAKAKREIICDAKEGSDVNLAQKSSKKTRKK